MRLLNVFVMSIFMMGVALSATAVQLPCLSPEGEPITVGEIVTLPAEPLFIDTHGTIQGINENYFYSGSADDGMVINLRNLVHITLVSYHIPKDSCISAELSIAVITHSRRRGHIGWSINSFSLGEVSLGNAIRTLDSLQDHLPTYRDGKPVYFINGDSLSDALADPDDPVLSLAALHGQKIPVHITMRTVAVIKDTWGNFYQLPVYKGVEDENEDAVANAPSTKRQNASPLADLPQELKDILEIGVSAKGNLPTTWGAIKSAR